MGMQSRFRARLRSEQNVLKLDSKLRDERIAETVCLLSVLFLLPYCSRGHAPLLLSLGGWCVATYSCLVLPLLISANYKYPARWLKSIICRLPGILARISGPVWRILLQIYSPLDRCERIFMKMTNLSNLAIQLVFFMTCDRVVLCAFGSAACPQKRITGLYTLMFYNVVAYCVAYIKELVEKEDWSPYVSMTTHGNLKHVAMSATKIVLEWTKAVTFIITVTFMLLVFGLEQGLDNYQPSTVYTVITWIYYSSTEKVFVEIFPVILTSLKLQRLEALEQFYAPVILKVLTTSTAILLSLPLLLQGELRFALVHLYLTVFLRVKDLRENSLRLLRREQELLCRFRKASKEEVEGWDDVCAVCLCEMQRARVTPCQHLFHAECLRQCLNNSHNCPICKREYVFLC